MTSTEYLALLRANVRLLVDQLIAAETYSPAWDDILRRLTSSIAAIRALDAAARLDRSA